MKGFQRALNGLAFFRMGPDGLSSSWRRTQDRRVHTPYCGSRLGRGRLLVVVAAVLELAAGRRVARADLEPPGATRERQNDKRDDDDGDDSRNRSQSYECHGFSSYGSLFSRCNSQED